MMRRALIALVLLLAIAVNIHSLLASGQTSWPVDFQVLWLAARAPLDAVYQPAKLPFVYPPTALLMFWPLGWLSFLQAYFLWIAASVLAFGVAAVRMFGGRIAAPTFASPAAFSGIILGQSTMLLSGLAYAAFLLPAFAGGALLGLIATIKPQIMLMAPLALVARREWRMLWGMVAGASGAMLLVTVIEPALWQDWLQSLPAVRQTMASGNAFSMITPAGRAEYYGLSQLPFLLLGIVVGAAAVVLAAKRLGKEDLVALIIAASLCASPYAHVHDTIALIPACFLLMVRGRWWAALPAALIFIGLPDLVALSMIVGLVMVAAASRGQGPDAAIPAYP